MGLTARWFWFDERGKAHQIAGRKWSRMMAGDDGMPTFARERVTIVQAIVHVDRCNVVEVVQLTGWRHAFDDRGYLDRERTRAGVRLGLETLDLGPRWGQPANVRSLEPRIAERRLAKEFQVTLTAPQRDAVLREIWKR